MPRYDFTSQRLFVAEPLKLGHTIAPDRAQSNYLLNVLRLKTGDSVLLFNGVDGEWRAAVEATGRKSALLKMSEQVRTQPPAFDLHYLFAPLKQGRLEYMVQKAVEMGVGILQPVTTQYTQIRALKLERMEAHVVEAAEQCGILNLASVRAPLPVNQAIEEIDKERLIIFCDEGDKGQNPLVVLDDIKPSSNHKLAVLVGPEGGFSENEREMLRAQPNVIAIPLGPRVLRADTAAVAALAIVQAKLGDWQE